MDSIQQIVIPLIVALISSYLTYFFTVKSKKSETILKFKEEKYSNLLILLQGFVGRTASGDLKKKFFEEQYKAWLYSSDDVIRAINHMVRLASDGNYNQEKGREAIGSIVLAVRKDLLNKTKLSSQDFIYTDVIP